MAAVQSVLERAKQGEPQAIATLMNQTLNAQGTHIQIKRRGCDYKLLVESAQVPNKASTVKWIASGLKKLSVRDMDTVMIYGKAQASDRPDWTYRLRFKDLKEKSTDPFAEDVSQVQQLSSTQSSSTQPSPTQSSSEPPLDLTEYCFTRNKSLLSGNLTLPSKAVIAAVLLFASLSNHQKLALIPHIDKLLRKPESLSDEALDDKSESWIAAVVGLEGNDLRKLSIWLSRYCINPVETVEQLTPKSVAVESAAPSDLAVEAVRSEEPSVSASASVSVSASASARVAQPTMARSSAGVAANLTPSAASEKVMFAKGSRTPAWAFPAACSLFLVIAIALGISSVEETAYLYPICEGSAATSDSCVLAIQLAGEESFMAETIGYERPAVTDSMKTEAATHCAQFGYELIAYNDASGVRPLERDESVTLKSSHTEEVFPGVLLTDVVLTDSKAADTPTRTACLDSTYQYSESEAFEWGVAVGDIGLENLSFDEIPMNWPDEPYAEIDSEQLSVARSLGIYDVFISLGANTLFTAVGIFVAVIFSSCYRCYTYAGVYQMASVLGVVETLMYSIPGFGWFASLATDVVAMGLASRFVKDFHIDWTEGYKPLAQGVLIISAIRALLCFLLYGAIAQAV